jgi:hypothetical protein
MFADEGATASASSEEERPNPSSSNSLRRMIENGMKDWKSYKSEHGMEYHIL